MDCNSQSSSEGDEDDLVNIAFGPEPQQLTTKQKDVNPKSDQLSNAEDQKRFQQAKRQLKYQLEMKTVFSFQSSN